MTRKIQPSFSSGELAPELHGRVDTTKYQSGLARARNVFVHTFGGISNRPGTRFVSEVGDGSKPVRLIPFRFSNVDTYILEFGHRYMRVLRNGSYVLSGSQPYEITTPYRSNDLFSIKFVQSADVMTLTHPSYLPQELSRFGHTSWFMDQLVYADVRNGPSNIYSGPRPTTSELLVSSLSVSITEGNTSRVTLTLSSVPNTNVTVRITPTDVGVISVDTSEVIFTPSNWDVGVQVAITAAADDDNTDERTTLLFTASGGISGQVEVTVDVLESVAVGDSQTILIPASIYRVGGSGLSYGRFPTPLPQISIPTEGGEDRYLSSIVVVGPGLPDTYGRVFLDFRPTNVQDNVIDYGQDLSGQFEATGSFTIEIAGIKYPFALKGVDIDEPYIIPPSLIGQLLYLHMSGLAGASITLRDYTLGAVAAPSWADNTGDDQDWTQNTAIADIVVPHALGNPVPTYSASGLPIGVSFDSLTRVISGIPTGSSPGTIVITAANSEGSSDWTMGYTVAAIPPVEGFHYVYEENPTWVSSPGVVFTWSNATDSIVVDGARQINIDNIAGSDSAMSDSLLVMFRRALSVWARACNVIFSEVADSETSNLRVASGDINTTFSAGTLGVELSYPPGHSLLKLNR